MDKILFTGGGTGGHIMPIIAIVRELKKISADFELHYVGQKLDLDLMAQEGLKVHSIISGKMRRYFAWQNFVDIPFKIPFSFLQAFFLLLLIRPNLVFSKGGTGSLPIAYMARLFRMPVFIHESDVYPGLSNRIASKWAKKVFVSFESTAYFDKSKVVLVGNPIRTSLLNGNRDEARKALNIFSDKPVMLILGGSQGSEAINSFIFSLLYKLLPKYELIHVVGQRNYKKTLIQTKVFLTDNELLHHYHLYEFLNEVELKNAYWSADIVVSRAGSGSIFEISALGKPSIIIPLPSSAHNHQAKNAYQYYKYGGCIVLEQDDLSAGFFIAEAENILLDKEKMQKAALKFAKPDAAEKIAKEIIYYLSNEK